MEDQIKELEKAIKNINTERATEKADFKKLQKSVEKIDADRVKEIAEFKELQKSIVKIDTKLEALEEKINNTDSGGADPDGLDVDYGKDIAEIRDAINKLNGKGPKKAPLKVRKTSKEIFKSGGASYKFRAAYYRPTAGGPKVYFEDLLKDQEALDAIVKQLPIYVEKVA